MHNTGSDPQWFFETLGDQIRAAPDQVTTRRHVVSATRAAREQRQIRRSRTMRWAAAITAVTTLLGTGGVAVAGYLPSPFQEIAADAARVFPVRLAIPYPTVPVPLPQIEPDGGVVQASLTETPEEPAEVKQAPPSPAQIDDHRAEPAVESNSGRFGDNHTAMRRNCELAVEEARDGEWDGDRRCSFVPADEWKHIEGEGSDEASPGGTATRHGDEQEESNHHHWDGDRRDQSDPGRREPRPGFNP